MMESSSENHQVEARRDAVRRARARLAGTNLKERAERIGLAVNQDANIEIALFGRQFSLVPDSLVVAPESGGEPSPVDELLILRYVEAEGEILPTGQMMTFRELPGGGFYQTALSKRTTKRVLHEFGNDLQRLRHAVARLPHVEVALGDLGVHVRAIGRIEIALVYRVGDDELPATLDVFYDRVITKVYATEEVAALTTNLCVELLRR